MTDPRSQPPPDPGSKPKPGPTLLVRLRQHLLHPEMSAEQVALSFGIGFSLAWNPFLGLHTSLVLLVCVLFRRLHRPLMLLACYINNPWTMVPMATGSALVGNLLLGRGWRLNLSGVHWQAITWRSFTSWAGFDAMIAMLKPILLPYLLGGLLLSALALPVGYYVMLRVARRLRSRHLPFAHPDSQN